MSRIATIESATAVQASTRSFTDAGSFASALLGGEFDCLPAPDGPFRATLRLLRVADMMVQHATSAPHVARGGIFPGLAVLLLPLQAAPRLARVNGIDVGLGQAVLVAGGSEIAGFSPVPLDWAGLALPLPLVAELAEIAPLPLAGEGASGLLALPPDRAERLLGMLSTAGRLAEDLPALIESPDCASGLAMALREEVAGALTAGAEIRPRPRAVGRALRIVAAAEAFMDADLARPVYTEQLCAALGVSARRLHDAFRAVLGMSPHAYLKSRRLLLVHRALRERRAGPGGVKSVALGHGFWHLGHFARDYRALFGELPSETLAARAGQG